ncbi:hypothetical protein [Pseudonocardia zijingensis]|jgi:hypothetical protein|uniref:Septum formation initiator n=1 Tax=Pseudonocardia zijingensis TaxID=153376 RepID=A0ABN1PBE0_9PSEU
MSAPRTWLAVLAWAATAVAATLVGLSAVGAIGSGLLGPAQEPLTSAEVDAELAAARAAPPPLPPRTSATPEPVPGGPNEVIGSPGGTVVARCTGDVVEIVSASPAQGYGLDDEPEHARVRFEAEETEVEIRLSCRDGRPVGEVRIDD